ncbi:MAG TPA: DNA repair protein RadC [Candidatus Ozemobacteraceae bacterium]
MRHGPWRRPDGTGPEGHRQRVRERYDRSGLNGFAEHEILEFLLFFSIPRRDTKPDAKRLLHLFRDLPGVFAASRERLMEEGGLSHVSARFLHLVRDISQHVLRHRTFGATPRLGDARAAVTYLSALMSNLPVEQFHVVFLDNANTVLADERLSSGTEDQTPVYPKMVMRRALALHATGILVAHNHPTGHLTPSAADHEITRALEAAARTLDIRLLDHLILGREGGGYFSFREHGFLS